MTEREIVYKVLMVIASRQGYILSSDVTDACIETNLSLLDTDWVSNQIIQQNIPILDKAPATEIANEEGQEPETSNTTETATPVFVDSRARKSSSVIPDGIYYCKGRGLSYEARMEVKDGYFTLKSGSYINHKEGPSLGDKLRKIRHSEQYVKDFTVIEDIKMTSPSSAAEIVTGRSTNGWTFWTTEEGVLIDDLRERR